MANNTAQTGDTATFNIKVKNSDIPDTIRVLSVYVEKRINRIAYAKLVILDGDADDETFQTSSSSTFVPGNPIVIEAGYDTKNTAIFKGIITGQTIRVDALVGSALEVECRDEAIKMIVGRKSLSFAKQKDSDVISSIIGKYSGISSDVSSTPTTWPEQVQYYATDWDYIMALAENNGMVVTAFDNKVSVFKPDANTSSVLTVKYGDGLMEFNANLQSIYQLENAKANAWDYKTQAVINGEAKNNYAGAGNLSTKELSGVVGLSEYQLQTTAPLESPDLTNWSKAQLVKSEFSKIQGEAKFQGTSTPNPGQYITLAGLGDRFNGDHIMSGVIHDISDGNWITKVNIGLPFGWFTEEPDVVAPPASGVLPGVRGLSIGTVKKMYEDPDSQYRILVDVPLFDPNGEGIWARLSNFYSTSGAGAFFLPEVGDEVVLGFLNEDPRYPIILGSMYSSTKIKPYEGLNPNEKNSIKAIVSKSGISIEFDDENKILTVNTPNKNSVILSDKDKQITMKDENDNSIVLSSSGISIKSPKSISIEATESVNIKGTQGIKAQSSGGDVAISGMNIKETADMEYSAEGSMTAKVTAGMQLTLKGAMVMIN
ncbi:type VI secretion system tip protein VgrG [Flavobacterium sp. LaA7.5]|nr:type VI secretion system tip protein VgrG [Flavobacterium salilacus subsp. altitudinum]